MQLLRVMMYKRTMGREQIPEYFRLRRYRWRCRLYFPTKWLGRKRHGQRNLGSAQLHWFNLSHTWGDTNDPGVSCGTDNVADTPTTRGVTACNLNENFCGVRANVENYMDYSYCSKMFTAGQVTRMRTALTSSTAGRNNLSTNANLVATGADGSAALCKAEFTTLK